MGVDGFSVVENMVLLDENKNWDFVRFFYSGFGFRGVESEMR